MNCVMFVMHSGEAEWPAKIEAQENSVAAMLTQHCTAAGLTHKQPKRPKHATTDSTDTQALTAPAAAATAVTDSSSAGSTNNSTTATVEDQKAEKPRYKPLLLTACTEPSTGGAGTVDIILYPDALIYTVDSTSAALQHFVQTVLPTTTVAADDDVQTAEVDLPVRPVQWRNLVLVCTHGNRDKRCGKAGPQVSSRPFLYNSIIIMHHDHASNRIHYAV
jgi:Sucrase/ferredoxin-like